MFSIKSLAAFLPLSVQFGCSFPKIYKSIEKSQWWNEKKLREHQTEKLSRLIVHAYENVPYYRRIFQERGLKPNDIRGPEDLHQLPYLTKEIVKANESDLIARNINLKVCSEFHTSGSTGVPMKIIADEGMISAESAFIIRAFESHDSRLYREKSVWLRSYVPKAGEPIYRYEPQRNRLFLSAYHLSDGTIKQYVELMNRFKSDLLVGYPSSLYGLALSIEKAGIQPPKFKVAHTGSECLLPEWKRKAEDVLGCPVKDHYGMGEMVSLFHRCTHSECYHENLEYGVTEIVDVHNGVGEVSGTSLWNYAMPLIRYRPGDRGRLNIGQLKCACGRGLPLTVSEFDGRADDLIITPDNRHLPGVNFYTLLYQINGVGMFRIIQRAIDDIEVQIVATAGYSPESEMLLLEGMRDRVGEGVKIQISLHDEIKRNVRTGKYKTIESMVRKDITRSQIITPSGIKS